MPKPYFLTRDSGLYVRFRVPDDVRSQVRPRFLVRSLSGLRGDDARLSAACWGVALSKVCDHLRTGCAMSEADIKKLIDSVQRALGDGSAKEWTATNVRIGAVEFGTVTTKGCADTQDFIATVKAAVDISPAVQAPVEPTPVIPVIPAPPPSPPLSQAIATHLADLEAPSATPRRCWKAATA